MWCLMRIAATGVASDWLRSFPTMPGVSHDGGWVVYTHIPPQDLLDTQGYTVFNGNTGDDVTALGKILIGAGDNAIILSPQNIFSAAYRTPQWRLWCARYTFRPELFAADKAAVGMDPSLSEADAKAAVRTRINNAPKRA